MKPGSLLALAVALTLISAAPGQAPNSSEQNFVAQADQDVTLRVSVNLVQVDVVVTDSKGRHIGTLKPEDFEVTMDGKPQKITHFSYIATAQPQRIKAQPPVRTPGTKIPMPPTPAARLKANEVKRTVAFVVDDLGLSFESIAYVRSALKKYVDQQMQPGDLVAILRTGAGVGSLQAFSADKQVLKAAIDSVKWNPMGRVGVSSQRAMGSDEGSLSETEFRERVFSVGTLGTVSFIVNGLKELPGRKSVVLFSEHMRMFNRDSSTDEVYDSMLRLADEANRASVVVYTIDPRGLPTLSLTAADKVDATRPDQLAEQMSNRRQEHWESQEGLQYLADKTGGFFVYNTNDISGGINKVLEDQTGYYLIGWNPGSDVFTNADPKKAKELFRKYHRIRVRVKQPSLTVRTRDGFYGKPDQGERPAYRTRDEQLAWALQSPFFSSDVGLRLTALFTMSPEQPKRPATTKGGKQAAAKAAKQTPPPANAKLAPSVLSLLHISAKDLTFTPEEMPNAKGKQETWEKAVIDILMITFGENGQELDRSNTTYTVRVKGETYKRVLKMGFIYTMQHPVKKPGAYQLRVAVRDAATGKAGSASQFIQVPDISKGKLALSGIVLKERDPSIPLPGQAGKGNGTSGGAAAPPPMAQQTVDDDPEGGPALRVFQPGKLLTYGLQVFNAKGNSKQPAAVDTQLRLYRDGKEVYQGKPIPLQVVDQKDLRRLTTGGYLRLGTAMDPGDYQLQVVATDKNAVEKTNTASQWIDFQIAQKQDAKK